MIEQAKFTYSPLGKAFEKQIKTIEDQERKEVEALKFLKAEENQQVLKSIEGIFPREMRSNTRNVRYMLPTKYLFRSSYYFLFKPTK